MNKTVNQTVKEKNRTAVQQRTGMSLRTRKMVLAAMFACLAFVLNTFVYFPAMAPFQHFVDVLAAVFLGPWYGFVSALLCGLMRMMCGRTIQAVAGAVFGPILGGLLYTLWSFWPVSGTGGQADHSGWLLRYGYSLRRSNLL